MANGGPSLSPTLWRKRGVSLNDNSDGLHFLSLRRLRRLRRLRLLLRLLLLPLLLLPMRLRR